MEGYNQLDHLFIYWIGHRKYVHIQMHLCVHSQTATKTTATKNEFNAKTEIEQTVKLWHF